MQTLLTTSPASAGEEKVFYPARKASSYGHFLWMVPVCLAPFLRGAVDPFFQAVLCSLIATAVIVLAREIRSEGEPKWGLLIIGIISFSMAFTLFPLPSGVLGLLNPEMMRLKREVGIAGIGIEGAGTLSISPGRTVIRCYQLLALAGLFLLARRAMEHRPVADQFFLLLSFSVIALGLLEMWRLVDGKGVWEKPIHHPAGTFANRNHFASWMVVGGFLCLGKIIQLVVKKGEHELLGSERLMVVSGGTAVAFALVSVVACGSRGGVLALVVGMGAFYLAGWEMFKEKRWGRYALLGGAGVLGCFLVFGEMVLERIVHGDLSFKLQIWRDALKVAWMFPITGTGLGTFETVFSIYKSFHGEGTFLHAENEYIQLLVETGFVVCGLVLVGTLLVFKKLNGRRHHLSRADQMLYSGVVAALSAFVVQSGVEFLWHLFATAALGAVTIGLLFGLLRPSGQNLCPAGAIWQRMGIRFVGVVLLGFGITQASAAVQWSRGEQEIDAVRSLSLMKSSVGIWPLDLKRQIQLARRRIEAEGERGRANVERELLRALHWYPYEWQLRTEWAWLQLAASGSRMEGVAEAKKVQKLNPRQPMISLSFARGLAPFDPVLANDLLSGLQFNEAGQLRQALSLSWEINRNPQALWEHVIPTAKQLKTFGDFAASKGLRNLALEAWRRIGDADCSVAARFILQGSIAEGEAMLNQQAEGSEKRLVMFFLTMEKGNGAEALRLADLVVRDYQLAAENYHQLISMGELTKAAQEAKQLFQPLLNRLLHS